MSEPRWVALARVLRPQGRRGEVLAEILTDFPERFAERRQLFLKPQQGQPRPALLEGHWLHKQRVVLKFAGVNSISEAEPLRGCEVVIPIEQRAPLDDDSIYISDLVGARLFDISAQPPTAVGEITGIIPEDAGPALLIVRPTPHASSSSSRSASSGSSDDDILIPFVKAYLRRVDVSAQRVEMALPAGLLAINAPLTQEEREHMRAEAARSQQEDDED